MSNQELINAIISVKDQCGTSREQQAAKAVLLSLLGAMESGNTVGLMNATADFSQRELQRLQARLN